MRATGLLIFVLIISCIGWTVWKLWQILPLPTWGRAAVTGIYILSFLVVFPHYMLGNRMPLWMATATYEIGNSWMIFFIYFLFVLVLFHLGRVFHIVPDSFLRNSLSGTCVVIGAVVAILVYGNFHYRHKYREDIDIETEKPLSRQLHIVLVSDIHAGYHNRKAELNRWVRLINAENPDLVLVAGDIIDGEMRPLEEWNYADAFHGIEAPVYACLGNHEYIAGKKLSEEFYGKAGIHLLEDSSAVVEGIRIVGRDDRSNPARKPLTGLFKADSLFTILLDHQPYNLEEAEDAEVDFQFSGHTHHGQVWPGNWITDAIFEKAFGRYRRGNTLYYVSSGLGIWGGKFRIGTRSEYIVLNLHN